MSDIANAGTSGVALDRTLDDFQTALLSRASDMGLPTAGVVVGLPERVNLLNGLAGAMSGLPIGRRSTATYLSKFIMAASAGLFDAALNYLWDETIGELRKRIVAYDLNYFFDNAVISPEKRKDLRSEDDLIKLTDDELIRAAAKIGFISPAGQAQLDLVRFMRNHASAAHPNQLELQPYSILGYLETCITQVIILPESPTMVTTSRLLANVKTATVSNEVAAGFATHFAGLRREQIETLANGLFGIYVSPDSTSLIRDNVRLLLPHLWQHVPEDVRYNFGVRQARFQANLDTAQSDLAREFLQVVNGNSYLPEDIRAADIDAILDRLYSAHHAMNNFYNEPPLARDLASYVGSMPVPRGVREKYVFTLITCFLGRSSGISWTANPIYAELVARFDPAEASLALWYLSGPDFAGVLNYVSPEQQFDALVASLTSKTVEPAARDLLSALTAFSGPKYALALDTRIKKLRSAIEPLLT